MTLVQIGQWVVAIIIAGFTGGGLTALIRLRPDRRRIDAQARKQGADAAAVLSDTAIGLVAPLRQEIDRLTRRVHELQTQIDGMSNKLERAAALLRRNGIEWHDRKESQEK